MAFFRKLFKGPRAYASTMPSFYGRWGEPKPLDSSGSWSWRRVMRR
jgi:hypothetical protein